MRNKRTSMLLNRKGVTLVELMVTLAIFGIVMAGVYYAYVEQVRHSTREYKVAESDMEFEIAKSIIERDIYMAGYGFANDYSGVIAGNVLPFVGVNGAGTAPDDLILRGTAVLRANRTSIAWSYLVNNDPNPTTFHQWVEPGPDVMEQLRAGDRVIGIEPTEQKIWSTGGWQYIVGAPPATPIPTGNYVPLFVYGVGQDALAFPFNTVRYYMGGVPPQVCSPTTMSLLRAEANDSLAPAGVGVAFPILSCVRDFQVAFGLDQNEDGTIDCWDNGGAITGGFDMRVLRTRLKQIRVYILVQIGNRDPDFIYTNPDTSAGSAVDTIRVGDINLTACGGGGAGQFITLTAAERQYRWRVISLSMIPRNILMR